MRRRPRFSDDDLAKLRDVCRQESKLIALYAFDLRRGRECNFAALLTRDLTWTMRLDLEVSIANALGLEGIELINLQRMSLVARFDVVEHGEPLYVGQPDVLASFIEETLMRYSAYYPLLEALYWKVETGSLVAADLQEGFVDN